VSSLTGAQKRAAMLITGTPRRVPTNDLLQELGLSNLVDRRKLHRLPFLHKLRFQASVPDYIRALVPNTRETDTPRTLRNVRNITHTMNRHPSYLTNPQHNERLERASKRGTTAEGLQAIQQQTIQNPGNGTT